jgi:hypothetical protein
MKNYIIHLPSIPASLESATKLKQDLEKYNFDAELYTGIRGDDAVRIMAAEGRVLHPTGLKGPIDSKWSRRTKNISTRS